MRLNFATLSDPLGNLAAKVSAADGKVSARVSNPIQKIGGTRGVGGTASIHAGLGRPTTSCGRWDTVGQASTSMFEEQAERMEMSHLSHLDESTVGRCKPSIHAVVPRVPPVPPKNHMNEIDREAFEERAAIMEFDGGLSRAEAERLAAESLGASSISASRGAMAC